MSTQLILRSSNKQEISSQLILHSSNKQEISSQLILHPNFIPCSLINPCILRNPRNIIVCLHCQQQELSKNLHQNNHIICVITKANSKGILHNTIPYIDSTKQRRSSFVQESEGTPITRRIHSYDIPYATMMTDAYGGLFRHCMENMIYRYTGFHLPLHPLSSINSTKSSN